MQCPPEDGDWHARREAARAILEKENFPFDQTFTFTVESNEQVQARATSFRNSCQEQLRLLGVQTDFDLVETVAYWSRPLMAPGETFCRATIPSRQTTPPSVLVRECRQNNLAQIASALICQMARKDASFLAYRVATARHCLESRNEFSAR